jgi:hypothetical protein
LELNLSNTESVGLSTLSKLMAGSCFGGLESARRRRKFGKEGQKKGFDQGDI